MLRSTSVVITTIGASPLTELSPVSRPTRLGAVHPHEVAVLLVRQRLQRRGVEGLAAVGERPRHRVLGDHRLARAGGRGDEHVLTGVEGVERALLEGVEREATSGLEPLRRSSGTRIAPEWSGVVGRAAVVSRVWCRRARGVGGHQRRGCHGGDRGHGRGRFGDDPRSLFGRSTQTSTAVTTIDRERRQDRDRELAAVRGGGLYGCSLARFVLGSSLQQPSDQDRRPRRTRTWVPPSRTASRDPGSA